MNRSLLPGVVALALGAAATAAAAPVTLIDDATPGFYNAGLGQVLDGTDPFFQTTTDVSLSLGPTEAPDLSAAAAELGDWLTAPAAPGGTWSTGPVSIPAIWTVEDETAIIYAIDGGATGLTGVTASFGVDNGIAVWLNGAFVGAEARRGGAFADEHVFALGDLGAGTHYLQLLREDHGGSTGYTVSVTGEVAAPVPLPAAGLMLIGAVGGLAAMRARRR